MHDRLKSLLARGLLVTLLPMVSLLSGCETTWLKPQSARPQPAFAPDTACVDRCNLLKTQCEQRQQAREQFCQDQSAQFQPRPDHCDNMPRGHCVQPIECLGADLGLCRSAHEDCLMACRQPSSPPLKAAKTDAPASTEAAKPAPSKD